MGEFDNAISDYKHRLMEDMRAANRRYEDGDDKRQAILDTLDAAIELVNVEDKRQEMLSFPLAELHVAIGELELGIVAPFLQATSWANRTPHSQDRNMLNAIAASSMSRLMEIGKPRKIAASQVADWLNEFGIKKNKNDAPIESTTVAGWRDRINQGKYSVRATELFHVLEALPLLTNDIDRATRNIKADLAKGVNFSQ